MESLRDAIAFIEEENWKTFTMENPEITTEWSKVWWCSSLNSGGSTPPGSDPAAPGYPTSWTQALQPHSRLKKESQEAAPKPDKQNTSSVTTSVFFKPAIPGC